MTLTVDIKYHDVLTQLQQAAEAKLTQGVGALFVTQCRKKMAIRYAQAIVTAAEAAYPDRPDVVRDIRQHFNCSHCNRFLSRAGHLVYGGEHGITSLFWDPTVVEDPIFKEVVAQMKVYVEASRIVTLYNPNGSYSKYEGTTTSQNGTVWHHLYINPSLLRHVIPAFKKEIVFDEFNKQFDRVNSLIKLTGEIDLQTAMWVEQLFQEKAIAHLDHSEENLKNFINLLSNLAIQKSLTGYTVADEYGQQTILVNHIWLNAFRMSGLTSLRGSILGKLLLRAAELVKGGQRSSVAQKAGLVSFWKEQTSTTKYMQTTRPSSKSQTEKTAEFLEQGGWLPSLNQRQADERDLPVHWEAKKLWTPIQGQELSAQQSFADFAARQGAKVAEVKQAVEIDLGYFFNEVLKHADALAVDLTDLTWKPCLINIMADMNAKPIFKWDTEEKRFPYIPYSYDQNFRVRDLVKDQSVNNNGRYLVPVLSITSSNLLGYTGRAGAGEAGLMFAFHGLEMPIEPAPALMAEGLKGEFYEHRRALQDYSKSTTIPRAEIQQAIGLMVNSRHPQQQGMIKINLHVRLNDAGKVLYGANDVMFYFDGTGFKIRPLVEEAPVITERTPVDTPEPAKTPAAAAPAASLV